jgi:hypothetical protein
VLLVMTQKGIDSMLTSEFTLGDAPRTRRRQPAAPFMTALRTYAPPPKRKS